MGIDLGGYSMLNYSDPSVDHPASLGINRTTRVTSPHEDKIQTITQQFKVVTEVFTSCDTLKATFDCLSANLLPSGYSELRKQLSSYATMRLGIYADSSNSVIPVTSEDGDGLDDWYGRHAIPTYNVSEKQKKWLVGLTWDGRDASRLPLENGVSFFIEDSDYTVDYILAMSHEYISYSTQPNQFLYARGTPGTPPADFDFVTATYVQSWYKQAGEDDLFRVSAHKSRSFVLTNSRWRLGGEGFPGTEPDGRGGVIFKSQPPNFLFQYTRRQRAPENQLYITSMWDINSRTWKFYGSFLAPDDIFKLLDDWYSRPQTAVEKYIDQLRYERDSTMGAKEKKIKHKKKLPIAGSALTSSFYSTIEHNGSSEELSEINEGQDESNPIPSPEPPQIFVTNPTPQHSIVCAPDEPQFTPTKSKHLKTANISSDPEEASVTENDEDYEDDEDDDSYWDQYDEALNESSEKEEEDNTEEDEQDHPKSQRKTHPQVLLEDLDESQEEDEYYNSYSNVETALGGDNDTKVNTIKNYRNDISSQVSPQSARAKSLDSITTVDISTESKHIDNNMFSSIVEEDELEGHSNADSNITQFDNFKDLPGAFPSPSRIKKAIIKNGNDSSLTKTKRNTERKGSIDSLRRSSVGTQDNFTQISENSKSNSRVSSGSKGPRNNSLTSTPLAISQNACLDSQNSSEQAHLETLFQTSSPLLTNDNVANSGLQSLAPTASSTSHLPSFSFTSNDLARLEELKQFQRFQQFQLQQKLLASSSPVISNGSQVDLRNFQAQTQATEAPLANDPSLINLLLKFNQLLIDQVRNPNSTGTPSDSQKTLQEEETNQKTKQEKTIIETHIKDSLQSLYRLAKTQGVSITDFVAMALDVASNHDKNSRN